MHTCRNSLWVVPKNFGQKYTFPELEQVLALLFKEKECVLQITSSIQGIEKCYRSFSQSFEQGTPRSDKVTAQTPESDQLRLFLRMHRAQSERYLNFATLFGNLYNDHCTRFRDDFLRRYHLIKAELKKVRANFSQAIEEFQRSFNGYDKYMAKLIKLNSMPQKDIPKLQKAIQDHDAKLLRLQSQYIAYHLKFAEYCQARDPLFAKIDQLIYDTTIALTKVIRDAQKIDSELFTNEKPEIGIKSVMEIGIGLYPDEDHTPSNSNFYVSVRSTINVDGDNTTLMPGDRYLLVDARGDNWQIQNRDGRVYTVPADFLVPI